ncbi:tetratricopeptide repeat protein [Rhodospirillum sp. A1_3_36]|uniref:tetratricopeptide repeat protein n=1 Tax=Rhodospirillum sp. A1_3_36 TaxID=3391666 RepID=UPI0039A64606
MKDPSDPPGIQNWAKTFIGDIHQTISISNTYYGEQGVLPASDTPLLPKKDLTRAFFDGPMGREADLIQALHWQVGLTETLFGRTDEKQAILAWAKGGQPEVPSVRLLSGEGGVGKTRLASEVAYTLQAEGWRAGFIKETHVYTTKDGPLFLILDYPEEAPALSQRLLDWVSATEATSHPVRLLLVSRRRHRDWDAWSDLLGPRFGRQAIAQPSALPVDEVWNLIAEAATRFADRLGQAVEPALNRDRMEAWLAQDPQVHGLPLYAMAAAVHAVIDPTHAYTLTRGDLLLALADREMRRVRRISEKAGFGKDGLATLIGLAVMGDGLRGKTIRALEGQHAYPADSLAGRDVFDRLSDTPWWNKESQSLPALRPDLPAVAFLRRALLPEGEHPVTREDLPDWLFTVLDRAEDGLTGRLNRLLYDLSSLGDRGALDSLSEAFGHMVERNPERAERFASIVSSEAIWLAPFQVAVCSALLGQPDILDDDRAGLLNNLANFLSALGRREEAVVVAREAVDLYRTLAAARPDAFTPYLAGSLNTLANSLSDLGRQEEAVEAARKAVDLYRTLAAARPDAFTPYLAGSLNNLANRLSDLGRREEALQVAREAVALYRTLAAARPDAFMPNLAMSLNNLANRLSDLGRREEALQVAREAVEIRRTLAATRPDAFTPDLAKSLNNLANFLSALGRREEALEIAREAVEIWRTLAAALPDAFTPNLAGSLSNLANFLSALGRREEALGIAREAVEIRRTLAAARPDAFTPDLAMSLGVFGMVYMGMGKDRDAAGQFEEGARLLAPFFHHLPQAHASLMETLAQLYFELAEKLSLPIDEAFWGPINEVLQRLQNGTD